MRSSTYRSMSKSQKIHLNATNHNKSKQGYYLKKGVKHIHASSKTGLNKFNSHRGYGLDKQNKFKSSSNLAHTLTQAPGLGSNRVFQSDKFRSSNRSNSPRLNLSSIKNPIKIKIKKHSDIQKPNIKSKPVSIDEQEENLINKQSNKVKNNSQKVQSIGSQSKSNQFKSSLKDKAPLETASLQNRRLKSRIDSSKSYVNKKGLKKIPSRTLSKFTSISSQKKPKYRILQEKPLDSSAQKLTSNDKLKKQTRASEYLKSRSRALEILKKSKSQDLQRNKANLDLPLLSPGNTKNTPDSSPMNRIDKIKLKNKSGLKSESTRLTLEKSAIQNTIKWELGLGERWDKIEQNLLFGQCIGEGSFARVYDGFDKVLKNAVAIKVIKKKLFKTDKKRKLVQIEVDILSRMNHRNIVKFERLLEDHKRVCSNHFYFENNFNFILDFHRN